MFSVFVDSDLADRELKKKKKKWDNRIRGVDFEIAAWDTSCTLVLRKISCWATAVLWKIMF